MVVIDDVWVQDIKTHMMAQVLWPEWRWFMGPYGDGCTAYLRNRACNRRNRQMRFDPFSDLNDCALAMERLAVVGYRIYFKKLRGRYTRFYGLIGTLGYINAPAHVRAQIMYETLIKIGAFQEYRFRIEGELVEALEA